MPPATKNSLIRAPGPSVGAERRLVVLAGAASVALWPSLARAATAETIRPHDHTPPPAPVIEFGEPVAFTVRPLADPYRLMIDVPDLSWTGAEQTPGTGL